MSEPTDGAGSAEKKETIMTTSAAVAALPNAVRFHAAAVPMFPGDDGGDVVQRAWDAAHANAKVGTVPCPEHLLATGYDHLAVIKIYLGSKHAPHAGYLALLWRSYRPIPADLATVLTGLRVVYEGQEGDIFLDVERRREVRREANSSPGVRSTTPRTWRFACDTLECRGLPLFGAVAYGILTSL